MGDLINSHQQATQNPASALSSGRIREVAKKSPIPNEALHEETRKLVHELYADDYKGAETPRAKLALASKLHEQAVETRDDPNSRFVLLAEAQDLAIQGGNIGTALRMIDDAGKLFEIDPMEQKIALLTDAAQKISLTATHKSIAIHAMSLVEEAVLDNDFATADAAHAVGNASAKRSRERNVMKVALSMGEELVELKQQFQEFEAAVAVLKDAPDDPDANLKTGKYHSFVIGDWKTGLPRLAKSNDATLQPAATQDLTRPRDPFAQAKVGDGWYAAIDPAPEDDKQGLRERAKYWYSLSVGQLSGLQQAKVSKRLDELRKLLASAEGSQIAGAGLNDLNKLPKFAEGFPGTYVL
ncbi:MAG: hypothetical protein N2C14_20455, partial [Planctomycetales bacterium]